MQQSIMSTLPLLLLLLFSSLFPAPSHAWGIHGHLIGRLSDAAAAAVRGLLPSYAGGNLSSLCSWADGVKLRYPWSAPLHYIDTPDHLCSYTYDRDCKDEDSFRGESQADDKFLILSSSDNLTQALLFLAHFVGDIHQPLHVGFTSDKGGNTIDVHWYTRKTVLHHVWDDNIIKTAENDYYGEGVAEFVDALMQNITGEWSQRVPGWEECSKNQTTCPDTYASESIAAACDWAYKDVTEDSLLEDAYFGSRLPVVNLRLAQGGVRLAATLNRIFS
ncbi:hypothetical protein OsI_00233 [Oryza sativa Indica Group]|uniref:Aspergillus nuclease S1 n=1 Tax=Oryza sativa subsp. indica TaxID=39946 RepID=A2WK84_ORYSI|nr:hypothetical protein OsI_00233 [Oryza sativa Indica Group]